MRTHRHAFIQKRKIIRILSTRLIFLHIVNIVAHSFAGSFEKAIRCLDEYVITLEAGATTETLYSENPEEFEPSRSAIPIVRQKNPTPGIGEQGIVNI